MSNELPPLPIQWLKVTDPDGVEVPVFRALQMRDFARAAVLAEREACAQACDELHHSWRWGDEADSPSGPRECAAAIRARSTP